jgi:predicted ATPase
VITQIEFKEGCRYLERLPRDTFRFENGLNLVIGPNGSGKSTLLDIFKMKENILNQNKIVVSTDQPTTFYYNKMIEKVAHGVNFSESDQGYGANLMRYFESSGQHAQKYFKILLKKHSDPYTLVVDEPETSLDIKAQLVLISTFKELVEQGHQIIIATHSPLLICSKELQIHFIEMEESYYETIKRIYKRYFK